MGRSNTLALRLRPTATEPARELTDAELMAEDVVNEAGAAEFMKCGRRRVQELKRRGLIPYIQDGPKCRVCYPVAGLREFMRRRLHR